MKLDPGHLLSLTSGIAVRAPANVPAPLAVAIPANNEADRIAACLAALAIQRDDAGSPVEPGTFDVVVLANNCTDDTASAARGMADALPYGLVVIEQALQPDQANAGHARKAAMDHAADRLAGSGRSFGAILTTDADSRVGPTWISATRRAFSAGADCVAGYIDAEPAEIVALGAGFLRRGRLEDRYIRLIAEIEARCDPHPHDPWPNHRVSSGASLAVTLSAYRAVGGLPSLALGEDAALTRRLDAAGFRVRHALDVCVTTSCRLAGRATGGAAETMRLRHAEPDAPCDADLEPARRALRRARLRGLLRHALMTGRDPTNLVIRLGLAPRQFAALERRHAESFRDLWDTIEALSPTLVRSTSLLRPSDLPAEIRRAETLLLGLRGRSATHQAIEPIDVVMHERAVEAMADHRVYE